MSLQFKTSREESDYDALRLENVALYDLVGMLETFVRYELNKPLVLTSIYRSNEEQLALYKDELEANPAFKVPRSHHEYWRAVDIRSSVYTETEIQRILKFLNTFTFAGGQSPVATFHHIKGNVDHFHIKYEEPKHE